jgi:hypothetical protein
VVESPEDDMYVALAWLSMEVPVGTLPRDAVLSKSNNNIQSTDVIRPVLTAVLLTSGKI